MKSSVTLPVNRALSLDALRGYAIITMVLSGQIASGILPAWMYHAQVPPPDGIFNPAIYGITWVDLVFPFFLFAMGAAFPLSVGRKAEKGESKWNLSWGIFERYIRLTYFAIFIQHLYPWVISPTDQTPITWMLSISGFILLFPMFLRIPGNIPNWLRRVIEFGGYGAGIALMLCIDFFQDRTFDISKSNIIILVLANMAFFGTLIYLFTIKNKWARIGVLPFILAVFLSSQTEGSWASSVFNYSPFSWMYQFRFLKYLFIVLPGSIAGEYLVEWMHSSNSLNKNQNKDKTIPLLLIACIGIIVLNLWGLFTRNLLINLFTTSAVLVAIYYLVKGNDANRTLWRKLYVMGAYLLMLGLFFEAYEGGIRKDDSTYSYYFVTSGLACFALIGFSIMCDYFKWRWISTPFGMTGKNPMIAYVACSMFIVPLFRLVGIFDWLKYLEEDPWLGFVRGVILTGIAMLIAIFFTKIKWFWRT